MTPRPRIRHESPPWTDYQQGNKLARFEAVQRLHFGPRASTKARLTVKRATDLAESPPPGYCSPLIFYGLRDGHIRAFDGPATGAITVPTKACAVTREVVAIRTHTS